MYNGGKNRDYQKIINLMPEHERYIEGCAGSLAVGRNKRPAKRNIAIEINKSVCERFQYEKHGFEVFNMDLRKFLKELQFVQGVGRETLVYIDLPYLKETRISQRSIYEYESTTELHEEILSYCVNLQCSIIISHYPCEFYDTKLRGWNTFDYTSYDRKARPRTERMYFNYDPPKVLHDWQYFGTDKTDRQRAKRKVARLQDKIAALPEQERNLLLHGIYKQFGVPGKAVKTVYPFRKDFPELG